MLDNGDDTKGFKDKENTIDYAYDTAGNMTSDANKDLSIAYNHLNLPASITRTNSGTNNGVIKHYYAGATKVRMETYDAAGTTLTKAYDYMAGMVYVTNPSEPIEANKKTLDFIGSPEGRAILTKKVLNLTADPTTGDKFRFEYSLKDHLGNLRVSCRCGEPKRDAQGIIIPEGTAGAGIEPLAVVQEQHYDPWGLEFKSATGPQSGVEVDRFTYNGKELVTDLDLGWNDYGFRMYDASVGRWSAVDALAEKGRRWSPYIYAFDNPIRFVDPDGMWAGPFHYLMTKRALVKAGFDKDFAKEVAHYASIYADAPDSKTERKNKIFGIFLGINPKNLSRKEGIDYSKLDKSQDQERTDMNQIHATRTATEADAGLPAEQRMNETESQADEKFKNANAVGAENLDEEGKKELGVAFHQTQDVEAHQGSVFSDDKTKNTHSGWRDIFGNKREARQKSRERAEELYQNSNQSQQ